ncbi:uncharacterized protein LOC144711992 [Wolffia australiana]
MRKRGGASGKSRARGAAAFRSPLPATPPSTGEISANGRDRRFASAASPARKKIAASLASPSLLRAPATATPSPQRTVGSVKELRDLFSSKIDAVQRLVDLSHSEIVKDLEASRTRLSKRLKLQIQACQQLSEEAEKDYRKTSDRITENMKLMKSSYSELMTEAQTSASRVYKATLPELAQSLDKAIDSLRSRYKIPPS